MGYTVDHFINGEITKNSTDRYQDIFNPATGAVIGQAALAGPSDIDKAIAAAKAALPAWMAITPARRSRILFKYNNLLNAHLDELAAIITREHGKTLNDARGSIQRGIEVVEFACGTPSHLQGVYAEEVGTGVDSYSIRQPLGICVGICPFNFPAMIPLWMFPIAIACGNTFILKPSEKDPSCSLRLAELMTEAGLPKGVLNVIQGNKEAVDLLLTNSEVKAVSFVGSSPVAEAVYKTATDQGKRVQALGGAKNHCVVMPDADLDEATPAILGAAYGSAGERCMAISVVLAVGEQIGDELIKRLKPKVESLKIGAGEDSKVEMGPLVTQQHLDKVKSYIDIGVKEGAELVVDGRDYAASANSKGFYLGGSLFDNVKPNMRIYKEEIFGPVLSVVRVANLDEAIQLVSAHELGNGAAIFTRDGETARKFSSQVQIGMVGINVPIPVPVAYHSFGGWKRSLFGDIHMHGPEGVQFYTKLKTITQRWPQSTTHDHFAIPT